MSRTDGKGASAAQADPTYKVGYCRPPEEHRFKKGVSGNPNGRPRKQPTQLAIAPSKSSALINALRNMPVRVIKNGQAQTITAEKALLQKLYAEAFTSDKQARRYLLESFRKEDERELKEQQKRFTELVKYKLHWAHYIHRVQSAGWVQPFLPVPHPDDILIDAKARKGVVNGPLDDIEKADWDRSAAERSELLKQREVRKNALSSIGLKGGKKRRSFREGHEARLAELVERLDLLDTFYPAPEVRRQPGFNLEQWQKEKAKGRKPPKWD